MVNGAAGASMAGTGRQVLGDAGLLGALDRIEELLSHPLGRRLIAGHVLVEDSPAVSGAALVPSAA